MKWLLEHSIILTSYYITEVMKDYTLVQKYIYIFEYKYMFWLIYLNQSVSVELKHSNSVQISSRERSYIFINTVGMSNLKTVSILAM